jgi:hypothetical protein
LVPAFSSLDRQHQFTVKKTTKIIEVCSPRKKSLLRILFGLSIAMLATHTVILAGASDSQNSTIAVQTERSADGLLKFRYSLPSDGFVTLVIDDVHGRRVRNLIGAAPRKAGVNTEQWDGTDDQGQAVPLGQCRWRLLYHIGIGVEYVMSYGNPGTPPWATADGTGGWGADHTKPQAAINTPDGVVLGWPTAEAGWFLIGVGPDGHKKWGLKNHYTFGDILINLATDGQYLYVASEQNAAPLMKYYKKLAHGVLYRYRLSDRKLAKIGIADEIVITDKMDGNLRGVAVAGDTAYVTLSKENKVAAVSLRRGRLTPEKDIAISAPTALTVDKSGALIVASGQQLIRVDLNTQKSRPLVSEGLDQPVGLCVDTTGKIYVSDRGKAQQVKVFSPDGKLLRSIGVSGGRPPRGPHQPLGMYQPLGLTIDNQGLLWVMEEDDKPKRVSVWNAATGAFVREYIGPPHYGALEGSVAGFDKTMAFGEGEQYHLDWDKKIYSFISTPGRAVNEEDVFGRATVRRIFQRNGRILTASNSHVQVVAELKDGALHPLAAVGEIDELTRRLGMYTGAVERKVEQLKAAGSKVDAKGNPIPATAFIWTDQNGDGIAQDSEFTWKPNLHWGGYWGTGIGDDLTVYMQSSGKVYRLPVTRWNTRGAPIYSFESATTIPYTGSAEHVTASPDGMLIVNAKPQLQGIDIASGQQRWSYPNPWEGVQGSHTADFPAPGRLIGPLSITGFATVDSKTGTLFAMNGNLGQQFLMTTDGLWVGALLRDWRLSKVEDMYTIPDEDFGGYFWRDQHSGEVYLEAGKTEYRLYKVTGLDTIRRSEGQFTLGAATIVNSVIDQKALRSGTSSVTIPNLDGPLKISGKLEDVPSSMHFTEVAADADSKFRFALSHDRENLYLVYDVTDDTPFQNTGQDFKQIFSTGDCVDLMFGVDPKADPRRKEGAAGDNRLLFSVKDGRPLAILYRQVDPMHRPPVAFMSPSRAVYFDSVTELHDAKIAVTRSKTGYVLTASVPLATLGIKQDSASVFLTGDVGAIFGSESGNGARLRLYWANKSTAITSDIPSEAALSPEHWGHFQFE